jgi:hypothetical protein
MDKIPCQARACGFNIGGECNKQMDNIQPNSALCPEFYLMLPVVAITRLRKPQGEIIR